jgi:phosphoribosylamine--glycine ligase
MNSFGSAGQKVVIEEYLEGEEASVLAICDGKNFVTLVPAQDHKRAFDGDKGKNTGGMGAYAPASVATGQILEVVKRTIIGPTVIGMTEERIPFRGCLYVGLMITPDGPKVLEYNCRFGDPEAQVVLPLCDDNFVDLLYACSRTGLSKLDGGRAACIEGSAAVCVVLASGGYPDRYDTGKEIMGLERIEGSPGIVVFHAGTRREKKKIVTSGGRVLGVTAIRKGGTVAEAREAAYEAAGKILFEGMHYRHDIGRKALVHQTYQGRERGS